MFNKLLKSAAVLGFAFLTGLFMQIGAEAGEDLYYNIKNREKSEEGLFRKFRKTK